jgi:hypothetical protein
MKHGGSLTINPETGLPEAGFLDKLLPAIIGFAVTAATGLPAWQVGLGVGAVETARTGDLGKGISAGLGAYGGAGLGAGMTTMGTEALGSQAAGQSYLASAPGVLADAGAGLTGDMAYNLQNAGSSLAGEGAASAAQQAAAEKIASASPFDKLSAGFDAAKANPSSLLTKDNAKYLLAASAPILADQAVKANLPTTTTRPGEVHTFSYNPYNQYYTPTGNYEVPVKKAAGGGLMGMDNGGYNPGQLNFTGGGSPIVGMAEGGVPGYAEGMLVGDQDVFNYFKGLDQTKLGSGALDAQIAADMQKYNVGAADIARITGTQANQGDYEKRFVNAVATPGITADQFNAYTADVGLTGQNLNTALQNSGMSAADQYALTHKLDDTTGTTTAPASAQNFYNTIGYTAGALPGDQGGLAGVYANINYSAKGLQDKINSGALTVAQAQNLALAEMDRVGVNQKDIKAATGTDFANLFKPKTETKPVITCGVGYRLNAAGTACEPIPVVPPVVVPPVVDKTCPTGYHWDAATNACVPNISSIQNTTTTVATPTNLYTAPSTALPVGIAGNTGPSQIGGGATVNPNGTITTSPRIPDIPIGGFTGMEQVRDAYTKGGGKLGYTSPVVKTMDEFNTKYNKLTGGSKAAYDYLSGKTPYSAKPVTETGEIMKPYAESVLGVPMNKSSKQYLFDPDTRKYTLNPDFIPVSYTSEGQKVYGLSSRDIATQLPGMATSDYEKWVKDNNVTLAQIAQALNISLAEAKKRYPTAGGTTDKATADANTSSESSSGTGGQAEGGLAALTMARGGTTHMPFFSKSTGKFNMHAPQVYGDGGMAAGGQFDLGSYSDGGRLLRGPGDGVSDSIPATIGNKRPARLADGEFVVPARIVSELGNGSTEAGARKLYAMMDRVQSARKGSIGKGKVANNSRADKYLPA